MVVILLSFVGYKPGDVFSDYTTYPPSDKIFFFCLELCKIFLLVFNSFQ